MLPVLFQFVYCNSFIERFCSSFRKAGAKVRTFSEPPKLLYGIFQKNRKNMNERTHGVIYTLLYIRKTICKVKNTLQIQMKDYRNGLLLSQLLWNSESSVKFEYGSHAQACYPFVVMQEEHHSACNHQQDGRQHLLCA